MGFYFIIMVIIIIIIIVIINLFSANHITVDYKGSIRIECVYKRQPMTKSHQMDYSILTGVNC